MEVEFYNYEIISSVTSEVFSGTADVINAGLVYRYVTSKCALPFSPLDYLHYSIKCVSKHNIKACLLIAFHI